MALSISKASVGLRRAISFIPVGNTQEEGKIVHAKSIFEASSKIPSVVEV